MTGPIHESGEMYLEHILLLEKEQGNVRSVDVANRTGFSKPSVSRAVGLLRQTGCITVDGGGYIALTEKGRGIAEQIYERHTLLTDLFVRLGVPQDIAVADACKIEHDISDVTFEAIKRHITHR